MCYYAKNGAEDFLNIKKNWNTHLEDFTNALWEYTESVDMAMTAQLSLAKSSTLFEKGVRLSA